MFEEAVSGKSALEGDSAVLYVYGEYLLRGGTREQFMELSFEDIQIMATVALAGRRRTADCIANSLSRIFGGKTQ